MKLKSINPYNSEIIEEFEEFSDIQIAAVINDCATAFKAWKFISLKKRSGLMVRVAEILATNKEEYARAITEEMGKTIRESRAEIEKCRWVCTYYADNAAKFLKPEIIQTDAYKSRVQFEPLGIILGIMPWNYPFWQVFRFLCPTLMAGNTVVLKHSSNVQICARHIENIFVQAGFPANVFRNLVISAGKVSNLIKNPLVKAVTLTGSEEAGSSIASEAGFNIKKTVLELGGSNAFVVLDDADIDKAVAIGLTARLQNAGQSCIAAKRFLVHSKVAAEFVTKLKEKIRTLRVEDPMNEKADIGPLASISQAAQVEDQVDASVHMGAKMEFMTRRWHSVYYPEVLTRVKAGMPVFEEEVFGPVFAIMEINSDEEAIEIINRSKFGLGVSIFTKDIARAEKLIPQIEDGAVFINAMVKSDPRLPFGGTKRSGYGRELSGFGIREFVNIKTVYIASA
jgi:succinate-semialdehyde dehydrogenase / glutarate-semialdehyde dehydrogenase